MADNFNVKDAANVTITFRATESGAIKTSHYILADATGARLIGQQTKAASVPFTPPSDWALLGSGLVNPSDSFARPLNTTPYAIGQLIANDTLVANVVPLSFVAARIAAGAGVIHRTRIYKSSTGLTNAVFRIHYYTAAPTIANGDGAAWLTTVTGYLGAFDVAMDRAFSDAAYGEGSPRNAIPLRFKLASSTTIKALIEARAIYTPGSGETFTVIPEIEQT